MRHLMGLVALMTWRTRWDRFPNAAQQVGPLLKMDAFASQRFAIAWPKASRYGKSPIVAIQREEGEWMRRIQWARAQVIPDEGRLVFVSRKVVGDGDNLQDLPAVGVSIAFDLAKKAELLTPFRALEGRGLWFDEEGIYHIDRSKPMWTMPLKVASASDPVFKDSEVSLDRSFREVVMEKIERSNRMFNPGYAGAMVDVDPRYRYLVDEFKAGSAPSVRPAE